LAVSQESNKDKFINICLQDSCHKEQHQEIIKYIFITEFT